MGDRRSAQDVLDDHLELARRGEFDEDLRRNYAEDVTILSGRGVEHGHEAARRLAALLVEQLPDAEFEYTTRVADGETGFLEWTATASDGARVEDGVDSFLIQDGLIRAQTIHYTIERPGLA